MIEPLGKYVKVEGGFAFKSSEFVKEGVPIIRISNFDSGVVNLKKCIKYPAKDFEKYQRYEVIEGDILMAMSGATTGKVGILKGLNNRCWLNQRVGNFKILNREKLFKKYLYYIITSDDYQRKLINIASGCAQPNISAKQLESIEIDIPDLETQKKIVSLLDKLENSKEWRKEADDLTKEFLKSVFLEMFCNGKYGEVELKDICDTSSGGTPSRAKKEYWDNGTIPWIKSGDLNKNQITGVDEFITEAGLKNSSAKYIEPNTVLIAMYGATAGKCSISRIKATTNQAVCAIVPKKDNLDKIYLLYWLRSNYDKIVALAFGGGQPNISQQVVRSLKIPLPPIELQNKFASIVKEVEAMKEQQKHSKNQINNLFNALMQKAFKGELKC